VLVKKISIHISESIWKFVKLGYEFCCVLKTLIHHKPSVQEEALALVTNGFFDAPRLVFTEVNSAMLEAMRNVSRDISVDVLSIQTKINKAGSFQMDLEMSKLPASQGQLDGLGISSSKIQEFCQKRNLTDLGFRRPRSRSSAKNES